MKESSLVVANKEKPPILANEAIILSDLLLLLPALLHTQPFLESLNQPKTFQKLINPFPHQNSTQKQHRKPQNPIFPDSFQNKNQKFSKNQYKSNNPKHKIPRYNAKKNLKI